MSVVEEKTVVIVGGGLVGGMAALMLARRGYHVKVFERREDIRQATTIEGHRSINLALSVRGISALKMVGLEAEVLKTVIPMRGRMIHPADPTKGMQSQAYGTFGECINSVDRKLLNRVLLDRAEALSNVELFFNHSLESVDPEHGEITVIDKKSGDKKTVVADYIIGADGAYSASRFELMKREPIDFSQQYVKHGYKELCIMPDAEGLARLPTDHLHIWPREHFMLIALPNQDNSFTVTLFYPYEELKALTTREAVLDLFTTHFPDALELIGREMLLKDFFANPASPLVTVKMNKYNYGERMVLLGDAIHAMVPFYGQGMNAGFEDCEVLDRLIEEHGGDLGAAIRVFTTRRRDDAHAICDLALYNYTEMSTLVNNRGYLARRWLYSWLHWAAPKTFVPLYTMVSFSQLPYSQAIAKRDRQDALVATAGQTLLLSGLALLGYTLLKRRQ